MRTLIKLLFILSISFNLVHGADVIDKKVFNTKSKKYYKKYKVEWDRLPTANKNRIIKAYKTAQKDNLGFTIASTMFLENRGMDTKYSNKRSIGRNEDANGHVTYDCGSYGINTMTYLKHIGKESKKKQAHISACKKLAGDNKLNLKMAMSVYSYAMDRYNGNFAKMWNYYNTGRDYLINDRIYKVKGFIMVLKEEFKKDKSS